MWKKSNWISDNKSSQSPSWINYQSKKYKWHYFFNKVTWLLAKATSQEQQQPYSHSSVNTDYTTVYRSQDGNEGLRLDYKGREGCHKQIPSMCMANTIHLRPNNTGKLVSTEIQWWWCFVGPPNTHTSDILTKQSIIIVSKKAQMKLKMPQRDWS